MTRMGSILLGVCILPLVTTLGQSSVVARRTRKTCRNSSNFLSLPFPSEAQTPCALHRSALEARASLPAPIPFLNKAVVRCSAKSPLPNSVTPNDLGGEDAQDAAEARREGPGAGCWRGGVLSHQAEVASKAVPGVEEESFGGGGRRGISWVTEGCKGAGRVSRCHGLSK